MVKRLFGIGIFFLLTSCSVKTPDVTHYKLDAYSAKQYAPKPGNLSIMVTQPEAVGGYQTEQMLYQKKPHELSSFVKNAWSSTPANMLFPLILQSLQGTHYFHAVASTPYADKADYRLDTQLLIFQQNFITKPSTFELVVKAVVTHMEDDRVVASRIFTQYVQAPCDNPYGGVIAANQASKLFTHALSHFVVKVIQHDP